MENDELMKKFVLRYQELNSKIKKLRNQHHELIVSGADYVLVNQVYDDICKLRDEKYALADTITQYVIYLMR